MACVYNIPLNIRNTPEQQQQNVRVVVVTIVFGDVVLKTLTVFLVLVSERYFILMFLTLCKNLQGYLKLCTLLETLEREKNHSP